jgi:16S rRNA (cytidine1402-2'-O)-methyltransferase
LEEIAACADAAVLFESPQRVQVTLRELSAAAPDRRAFVGRELTKLHEEGLRGSLSELAARAEPWRGELVLVLSPLEPAEVETDRRLEAVVEASLQAAVECGASPSRIARRLAEASGLPRTRLYARALELSEALGARDQDDGQDNALESSPERR